MFIASFLFYSNLACKIALKICIFQTSFKEISLEFAKVFALEFFINLLLSYLKWQNYTNITFFCLRMKEKREETDADV